MYEVFKDYRDGTVDVFDSTDWSVERVKISDLQGIEVKGLLPSGKLAWVIHEKRVVFGDVDFCFVIEQVSHYEWQNNFIVYDRQGQRCYTFGYNKYINKNTNDEIKVTFHQHMQKYLECRFYGKEIGFSLVLLLVNKQIVKPVWQDRKYVSKDSKLQVSEHGVWRTVK